ncbi:hypothetical protein [Bifidobacterium sp. ESL0790]|uniref:hypothetical protein n=1 Tax=Bifidobacterium sp. ESL0790 TaxID=2983233 RepID=UPI0023F81D1E|nr:hypothetical protein [Bifidobacterium sp. ESL0790]WEV72113.1 hypothetical protein OZY47_06650 [Bifidobacterium sp. ESL0790]
MQFYELKKIILDRTADAWHHVRVEEGQEPASMRRYIDDPDDHETYQKHTNSPYGRAVLREDIDIAIEWGQLTLPYVSEVDGWKSFWTDKFPDRTPVSSEFADLLYRGSLVDRYEIFPADGGKFYCPYVRERKHFGVTESEVFDSDFKYWTTIEELKVCELLNSFEHKNSLAAYFDFYKYGLVVSNMSFDDASKRSL